MSKAENSKARRKRNVVLWIFGAFIVLIAGFYFIPNFPLGPYSLYGNMSKADKSQAPTYSRLADTSLTLDYTPEFEPDADALKRFPGVRDCLVETEAKAETPDLRLINWNRIRHEEDAELCLWWIFLSLETPERAEAWMRFHNMGLYEPTNYKKPYVTDSGEIAYEDTPPVGAQLYAKTEQWNGDKFKFPNSGHMRLLKRFWAARFYASIWNTNGQLSYVNVELRTK